RKVLDLIGENNSRTIAQLLRILSDNQPLTDEEMKTALTDNIAGEDTAIAIGIDSNSEKALRKKWRLEGSLPPPAKTFQEFPVTHDGRKLTAFLVRMKAITSSKRKQQYVLMAKMADRANNVSHPVETWHPRKKREIIRDTVSRLIAWGMLDHNNENYPLYNILPRLIDKTIRAYKRLKEESPQSIEQLDSQYMAQLQTWSTKVKRWQVPEEVQAVLDNYNSTKKAA
ncbi:hypothetical protein HZC20_00255, partial [Candidatus Peregrinibacteria bacterium]|nr:hypothetical protein [Candidatus Peregrinibacteria bacterium]